MCEYVQWSINYIEKEATHVKVNKEKLIQKIKPLLEQIEQETFDESIHEAPEDIESRLRYILVVDALNFCFWPTDGFEYDDLTKGLTKLENDHPEIFEPSNMMNVTVELLSQYLIHDGKIIANVPSYSQMDPVWATNYLSLCFCGLRCLGCLASL